jgi:hypothetical protein
MAQTTLSVRMDEAVKKQFDVNRYNTAKVLSI